MKKMVRELLLIITGLILTSAGISLCYVPNKIVSGGVSGLSTILYHVFNIPAGISFAVINGILIILGIKILGKSFIIKTVICAGILSGLVEVFALFPPLTDDIFLASVAGAVLYGFGIALTFVGGASTGGTDILGRILQHFIPHMPIGKLLLVVDAFVIGLSLVVFKEMNLTLYGIIALFISTFAIDWLMRKLNVSKMAFVVTEKGEEMARYLTSHSPRGVTIISVRGGYTFENKYMLLCALKEKEVPAFEERVKKLDSKAFTIFSESSEIIGNGFYLYR
ncbi:MAG: YitT family protein [Clostridia bacterium]|nr:YitT family protein [Clostridia bacterium]